MYHQTLYAPTAEEFILLAAEAGVANWDDFSIAVRVLKLVQQKQEELMLQDRIANGMPFDMEGMPQRSAVPAPLKTPPRTPPKTPTNMRPNLPSPPPSQQQSNMNAEVILPEKPVLRRSQRLIERAEREKKLLEEQAAMQKKKEVSSLMEEGVEVKREVERAWSLSPCVSHSDFVAYVKEEMVIKEEEGSMVEEEEGRKGEEEEEEEEPLAVPLLEYDEEENGASAVCNSPERDMVASSPPSSPMQAFESPQTSPFRGDEDDMESHPMDTENTSEKMWGEGGRDWA